VALSLPDRNGWANGEEVCSTELGIDVIETSHEISENVDLAQFAQALSQQFPHLRVRHTADEVVWAMG